MFKENTLSGKVAFISGGTSGINLGIAKSLAKLGAKVSVIGRDLEKANKAAAEISEAGEHQALAFSADVRDYAAVNAAIASTVSKFGSLDIVVAGAAGNFFAPAIDISPNGFKTIIDIDLIGSYHVFRAAFDHCTKPGARFIAITAPQAVNPTPLQAHVCAAKAGVNALLKTLAMEWGPAGITVNGIAPGLTAETEGLKRLFATEPAAGEKLLKALPMRYLGSVDDIGAAAAYLSSDLGSYITGTILEIDGGYQIGDASIDCLTSNKKAQG